MAPTSQNNVQDDWERGGVGMCVNLYDENQNLLQQTSTDSNGYYGFNVSAGKYFVAFEKPNGMEFSQKDVGDEEQDSDVDQTSGWSDALDVTTTLLHLDVGLIQLETPPPTSNLPPAQVGPVRSGRLIYADIAAFFRDSCLIYAYASPEVFVELPKCTFVDHNLQGGGYMLDISEMRKLAEERRNVKTTNRYVSNIFSSNAPEGGKPATRLDLYVAWLNQTGWVYDPLSQTYWRYVDDGDEKSAGILHPEVDRLTGRQLQFENVIVLFAQHDVVSPTNLDIHLEQDWVGDALLFRDGQVYELRWSTRATIQAPIIVTFHAPADPRYEFKAFYAKVRDRGFILYPGKLTQVETFRVGCIGAIGPEEMQQAVHAIADALAGLGIKGPTPSEQKGPIPSERQRALGSDPVLLPAS